MCIGILAEATYGTFMQGLTVHVAEKLPSRIYLTVFDHTLHRHTVVPEPDGSVMVCVILMVIVPVFVLWVELRVPLCERSYSPWIYELFPDASCDLLLEIVIANQVKAVNLVWSELGILCSVYVKVVIYECVLLVAIVALEVRREHLCESAPFLC